MIVGGAVRVPGDKSITHRALLFAALARGKSHVGGALTSLDARSSARVLRQLGAEISPLRPASVVSDRRAKAACAGRRRPSTAATRAPRPGSSSACSPDIASRPRLTGDASLRRRPMRRVTLPLSRMGAKFTEQAGDGLPLTVRGGALTALTYEMPVSSAQIKSAILLAGLAGGVEVALREPHGRSRDHSERLLRAFGYRVDETDGWIRFAPTGRLEPFELQVPGDPSSAAFLVGAAVLAEAGELRIAGVGVNPTRTGFLAVLARMGAPVAVEDADRALRRARGRSGRAAGAAPRHGGRGRRDPGTDRRDSPARGARGARRGNDGLPPGRRAPGEGERPAGPDRGEPAFA